MLTGEINDVRLKELTVLNNLEELAIMDFEISNSINDILEQFPKLKTLKFGNCDFEGCTEIKTKEQLKSFAILGGRNVNMKRFPSAQFLQFEGIEVPFESIDLDSLKVARVYGCRVIDAHDIADKNNIEEIELVDSLVYGKKDKSGRRKKVEYLEVPKGIVLGVDFTDDRGLDR